MEDNNSLFRHSDNSSIVWQRSAADFVEFVLLLTDFYVCLNHDKEIGKEDINRFCDALGEDLLQVFSIELAPHQSFAELRKNITPDYEFSKSIIKQLSLLKDNDGFYIMLQEQGITPSYEYMSSEVVKWSEVSKISVLIWQYLKL